MFQMYWWKNRNSIHTFNPVGGRKEIRNNDKHNQLLKEKEKKINDRNEFLYVSNHNKCKLNKTTEDFFDWKKRQLIIVSLQETHLKQQLTNVESKKIFF